MPPEQFFLFDKTQDRALRRAQRYGRVLKMVSHGRQRLTKGDFELVEFWTVGKDAGLSASE